jgi:hypothetical protein
MMSTKKVALFFLLNLCIPLSFGCECTCKEEPTCKNFINHQPAIFHIICLVMDEYGCYLPYAVGVAALVAVPFVAPFAVGALGFGATGIVKGTIAAKMMTASAGYVASGSTVAVLQSVGAAGVGKIATVAVAATATVATKAFTGECHVAGECKCK